MTNIRWRARYSDGTWLDQVDGQSIYPTINRKKLAAFDILDTDKDLDVKKELRDDKWQLVFRMWLEKGQRLIYRHRPTMDLATGNISSEFWLVGYQEKINGKNNQVINYVFPNGHVEQAGKWIGGLPIIKDYEVET